MLLLTLGLLGWFSDANSQLCNYFEQEDWASGYAQPLDRCIVDSTNQVSRRYECSLDHTTVTATRYDNSTTCDETIANTSITSIQYTADNASFVCNGNDTCDMCVRIYGDCDKGDNYYEQCWINNRSLHNL